LIILVEGKTGSSAGASQAHDDARKSGGAGAWQAQAGMVQQIREGGGVLGWAGGAVQVANYRTEVVWLQGRC
jgi:hypothetical protein